MMRGVASTMEKHHKVQILDEALEAAVKLIAPLHPGTPVARQVGQPDRHRLRRVAVSLHATPAEVDDCRKRIDALNTELAIIGREKAIGIESASAKHWPPSSWPRDGPPGRAGGALERRKDLVDELLALRAKLRDGNGPSKARAVRWKPRLPSRTAARAQPLSDEERAATMAAR
jgi:type VI secretion system protein VasG